MNTSPRIRPNPVPMNRVMIFILRSPLHGLMSKQLMVITLRGRKSGELISTPVSYIRRGREVRVLTRSRWHKNLEGGQPVSLRIQGRDYQGQASVSADPQAVAEQMRLVLKEQPMNARFFNVALGPDGTPDEQHLQAAAQTVRMVTIQLN